MGQDSDEWFYSQLLDFFKKKEQEKDDLLYRPIELELPILEPPADINDEKTDDAEVNEKRGIIIIDF